MAELDEGRMLSGSRGCPLSTMSRWRYPLLRAWRVAEAVTDALLDVRDAVGRLVGHEGSPPIPAESPVVAMLAAGRPGSGRPRGAAWTPTHAARARVKGRRRRSRRDAKRP